MIIFSFGSTLDGHSIHTNVTVNKKAMLSQGNRTMQHVLPTFNDCSVVI